MSERKQEMKHQVDEGVKDSVEQANKVVKEKQVIKQQLEEQEKKVEELQKSKTEEARRQALR